MANFLDRVSGAIRQVLAEVTGSVELKHEGEGQSLVGRVENVVSDEGGLDQIAQDDEALYGHPSHGGSAPAHDVIDAEEATALAREDDFDLSGNNGDPNGRKMASSADLAEGRLSRERY